MRIPPPWSIVTAILSTTRPANETTPGSAATTGVPAAARKSMPQCPEYPDPGANGATIGPGTGGRAQPAEAGMRSTTANTTGMPETYGPDGTAARGL